MTSIVIFNRQDVMSSDEFVNEIKRINPDKIVIESETEVGIEEIHGPILNLIEPWLIENNKTLNVLTPHLNNVHIRPNIIGEMAFGSVIHLVGSMIDNRPDGAPFNRFSVPHLIAPYIGNFDNRHFDILYTCYNNVPKFHRIQLVDLLAKEKLLSQGIVTISRPETVHWKYHDGSPLFDEPDFKLHSKPEFHPNEYPKNFHKGFFDIVGETWTEHHHMTEKTMKSILMFKPFIANSSKGYHLEYLFDYIGLQPYTELFDYSFDSYDTVHERVSGIVENVKRLSKLTVTERQKLYKTIVHKLIHNKSKLVELLYDKSKILPKSLQFLTDGNSHTIYGHCYDILYMRDMGWINTNTTFNNISGLTQRY